VAVGAPRGALPRCQRRNALSRRTCPPDCLVLWHGWEVTSYRITEAKNIAEEQNQSTGQHEQTLYPIDKGTFAERHPRNHGGIDPRRDEHFDKDTERNTNE